MIDTSLIKTVEIDVDKCEGRFGAGLTWGELDAATQVHGLAVTGGRITHTGIAGFTWYSFSTPKRAWVSRNVSSPSVGSGSGWLERKYGMTAVSLLAAQVVTADGRLLNASADEPGSAVGLEGRRR